MIGKPPAAALLEGGGAALAGDARQRRTTSFQKRRRRRLTDQRKGKDGDEAMHSIYERMPGDYQSYNNKPCYQRTPSERDRRRQAHCLRLIHLSMRKTRPFYLKTAREGRCIGPLWQFSGKTGSFFVLHFFDQ